MVVVSDDRLDDVAVVDVIERLVRRSLVVAESRAGAAAPAGPRYRLLETMRAFAAEKLDDAGETPALRRRHAQHVSERFAGAAAEWLHASDAAWWATYLCERDNVRAALDWAFGTGGDAAIGIALVGTTNEIWKSTATRREGHQWIETALARVDGRTPAQQCARLWLLRGMALGPPDPDEALQALERAATQFRQADDRLGRVQCHTYHGHLLAILGKPQPAAHALADAALGLDATLPPRLHIAYFDAASMVAFVRDDLAGARAALERALDVARGMQAERFIVFTLSHLGDVHWTAGDLDRAEACLREAIALASQLPRIADDALDNCKGNLLGVLVEKGRVDEPLVLARGCAMFRTEQGRALHAMDHLALRALFADRLAAAAQLLGYTDACYARAGQPRQRNEQRARDRVDALLRPRYTAEELATLRAAGAALTDAAACELALRE